mgnify:CR=1 FL=1
MHKLLLFKDLKPRLRKWLIEGLTFLNAYKGKLNPKQEAELKFANWLLTNEQWKYRNYTIWKKVDEIREGMGLERIFVHKK